MSQQNVLSERLWFGAGKTESKTTLCWVALVKFFLLRLKATQLESRLESRSRRLHVKNSSLWLPASTSQQSSQIYGFPEQPCQKAEAMCIHKESRPLRNSFASTFPHHDVPTLNPTVYHLSVTNSSSGHNPGDFFAKIRAEIQVKI